MLRFASTLFAAALIGSSGFVAAGQTTGPTVMTDAEMSDIVAGHAPGIARQIEPSGLAGNGDGTPAYNGHQGVLSAQSVGGTGNHPNTGTTFAGPSHPLLD